MKAIIFDLGGVLIDLDMHQCFTNILSLGIDIDALSKATDSSEQGATICEGMTASGVMHLYQIGKVSTADLMGQMLRLSRKGTTPQQILDAWNSCLLTIPTYKLDFIQELRQQCYAIYLLSNTNDAHWKYIVENSFPKPISHYFDHCFLSQEMGLAKPDATIFLSVLEQIGLPADECLFLDDSKVNCDAATALGIHCINVPVKSDFREDVRRLLKDRS